MLKNLMNRLLPARPEPFAPVHATAPALAPAPAAAAPPDDVVGADALIVEGNALDDAGQLAQAESLYRQAIAKAPRHARAHLNLGILLAAREDIVGATAAYESVLALDPQHPFGNYNYARLALVQGDLALAETLVAAALRAKPDFHQALVVQSGVLDALGRLEPAIASLQAALQQRPDDLGAWQNLALLLQKAGRPDDAEMAVLRVLAGEPDNLEGLKLSTQILLKHSLPEEALACVRKIVQLDPTAWTYRSFELMLMSFVDDVDTQTLFQRHVEFGRDMEAAIPVRFNDCRDATDPGRRLRVGYLSGDLHLHPVAFFLAPVLERHDRSQVEVHCYSFGPHEQHDSLTSRLRKAADRWCDVVALSDTELADRIHADGIDVLVDLTGHSGQPRIGVLCERPAPVQVGWLGYLNTTGLTRMDFRLCDGRTDPVLTSQPVHTERLVHMPESQWCYQAMFDVAIDPVAPFERNGYVTFGSSNSAIKITPATCRRWAQILLRLPGSRLLIGDIKSRRKRAAIMHEFRNLGVASDRIEFVSRVPLPQYLDGYNQIDVSLDTFPYGGGTTTFDSLWMGVPVVTTMGATPVSRSAASILASLGMDEWIAPSVEGVVDLAVARASDGPALLATRRALRARMAASPLTDIGRFVADLETAYRGMWRSKAA